MELSEEVLADVAHLLPESMVTLIGLIGMEAAFALVKHLGGTTFPVSEKSTKQGKIRYAMLAEIVGERVADKLTITHGSMNLYIPRCFEAMRELQKRMIRRQFDELTRNMTATDAVIQLAITFKIADRTVWNIIKTTDKLPEHAQSSLF